ALMELAARLAQQRPGTRMLITGGTPPAAGGGATVIFAPAPTETLSACDAFLAHWRPALCLWTGGALRPALLAQADRAGVPLFLVDADMALLDRRGYRWLPDPARPILRRFTSVMARSRDTAQHLRRLGVSGDDITVTGPFREGAAALPHDEEARDRLATLLRGRPVWLAAMLRPEELGPVLAAHRDLSRIAHRALLIVVPDDTGDADAMRIELRAGDWRFRCWSLDESPEETTQVLLADTRGEMGLWYRLSPITFMGSSLVPGQHGRDPNEPAAHGSAILYGPNVRTYLDSYSRYAEAGAARIVRDAETLGAAVRQLIAPDKAAAMATAAWDVASEAAQVTDSVLDLVQDTLDLSAAGA
ncbi:3-deoxy-D-manno-octulosonic acid transferase, partial [Roseovarius sp. SYSU LYC5161]|uniref:3-deoxy-D-manno-octulosonic acid transferase n=1 Tax=Roseovarius halophilus (ex Wu et al. 2025) TaxID=3376060 RepID=UPI00399958AA